MRSKVLPSPKGNITDAKSFTYRARFLLVGTIGTHTPVAFAKEDPIKAGERISNEVMSAPNPETAINGLSQAERETFELYNTPSDVETIETETLQAATMANKYCRIDGVTFGQKAILGNTLYTWWQRVEICGNPGVQIDDVRILEAGGETKTPTWSYDGNANTPTAYATTGGQWTSRSSESFSQTRLNRRTECVTATIVPSGEYRATSTC
ncbi:hypothetical protein [Corynebacterium casei]|uniref:hypothetical protein n=1 Tax=Corynebacterium casei TaxID=160386 RepID=UPI0026532647|nr:hypothetical protein [Corynebacterium casei]